jgi:hypothetical protein
VWVGGIHFLDDGFGLVPNKRFMLILDFLPFHAKLELRRPGFVRSTFTNASHSRSKLPHNISTYGFYMDRTMQRPGVPANHDAARSDLFPLVHDPVRPSVKLYIRLTTTT